MAYFQSIDKVKFEGMDAKSPFAFRYYSGRQEYLEHVMNEIMFGF